MPAVNGYDSDELMEDGYVQSPASSYSESGSLDEDEESASEASDLESSPEVVRQRFQVRRTNIHDHQHLREQNDHERSQNRRDQAARRSDRRQAAGIQIGARRAPGGDIVVSTSFNMELDDDVPLQRRGRGRPSNAERERRRQYEERLRLHQNDEGQSLRRRVIDESYLEDPSDQGPTRPTRAARSRLNVDMRGGASARNGLGSSSSPDL